MSYLAQHENDLTEKLCMIVYGQSQLENLHIYILLRALPLLVNWQ